MPLHLLGKKSWNVWNQDNIARVDRDIARGEAIEEEQNQRMQEYDSARRQAILRGEAPPTPPRILSTEEIEQKVRDEARGERRDQESGHGGRERKRRKLKGEDETDMELRLAKEDKEERYGEGKKQTDSGRDKRKKIDAPIMGPNGHINLFPIDPRDLAKEKNAEAEAEKAKKQQGFEDQYTMRFSNAAGRDGLKESPWYAAKDSKREKKDEDPGEDTTLTFMEYKNLWGKPDPRRKDRELKRASASDPFAMMQKAQNQLKKAEKDKKAWAEEKEKELAQLKEESTRREQRDKKRKRRDKHNDEDGLEGFSLDGPTEGSSEKAHRGSHREERHEIKRSRDGDKRDSHRKERIRSRIRDRVREDGSRHSSHYQKDR